MKKTWLNDLAVFGADAAFPDNLHVGKPNIGNEVVFLERVQEVLKNRWLTNNGRFVIEFERKLSALTGAKHVVAVCNATVGLEILVRALDLGGEVIVPSYTFVATAHALQWQKITPVFCDVGRATHNIDPACIEPLITPRTTGILGVHIWGRVCAIDTLHQIASRHGLKLLFDAAHALGCSFNGIMVGNFGQAEVFSFHATKICNSFEGGAIATNSDSLATTIRLMVNFGFAGHDHVISIGTNGKMNEVSAAMGLTSLECLSAFISANYRNYQYYQAALANIPGIQLTSYDALQRCNYQYIVLEVDEETAGLSRDDLCAVLWAEKVLARRYFYPCCHRMEPYQTNHPYASLLLPETERLARRVLCLPTGTAIGHQEIECIASVVRIAIRNAGEVKAIIRGRHPGEPLNAL